MYSGTNPYEAVGAAYGFLSYMKERNVKCLLTTHYLDLCDRLKEDKYFKNVHMKVESIKNDKGTDFHYTYEMVDGISEVKGGMQVLMDLGYPKEIIKNAIRCLESKSDLKEKEGREKVEGSKYSLNENQEKENQEKENQEKENREKVESSKYSLNENQEKVEGRDKVEGSKYSLNENQEKENRENENQDKVEGSKYSLNENQEKENRENENQEKVESSKYSLNENQEKVESREVKKQNKKRKNKDIT